MKYQQGESSKVLRKVTYASLMKHEAEIGNRQTTDLDCLRGSAHNDKVVMKNLFKGKPAKATRASTPMENKNNNYDLAKELERIVAKKSFFLNPHRNDPKIIQTKNRLYVI